MKIQITEWKPFNGVAKAMKGKLNVLITLADPDINVMQIKDISFFDNGSKKWIQLPEHRTKTPEGKWVTDVCYIEIIEPKIRFQEIMVAEITKYLASKAAENGF